jgi:hypothetical protein
MQGTCPVCNDATAERSQFCKPHHQAHVQLESAFGKWQLAYGNEMSKRAFLERILQLPETGQKAREVASFLLEKDSH